MDGSLLNVLHKKNLFNGKAGYYRLLLLGVSMYSRLVTTINMR